MSVLQELKSNLNLNKDGVFIYREASNSLSKPKSSTALYWRLWRN